MPLRLTCHPDFPTDVINGIDVTVEHLGARRFKLQYDVFGAVDQLALPTPTGPERMDNLWRKTCFEAFVGAEAARGYLELNFSPSAQWAVYTFENYRFDMGKPELVAQPIIETSTAIDSLELVVMLDLYGLPALDADSLEIGLSAVLLEKNGRQSLWALSHPSGHPDFHNRDCFIHKMEMAELR
jgi:hypothetical protein